MKTVIRNQVLQSEDIAIADDKGSQVTYKELAAKAEKLAQALEGRSLIFLLCDHQIETIEFLYEVLYLNLVPLLLPEDIERELLENLAAVYKPQYIYCKKSYGSKSYCCQEIGLENHVLLITGNARYLIHPDVALLLSTSGTTGSAKLVKLSYENLYDSAEQVCLFMDIQRGRKGISPTPICHIFGLKFCVSHWHCGATLLVSEESILSKKFSEFYIRERVNHFGGTTYTYQMLERIRFWNPEKLESLHWALSVGSPMPEKDQAQLVSILKDKFWIAYGQTECTGFISGINFDENNMKSGSVGKVLKNIEVMVDDRTNELILKSSCVSMGYACNAEQLAEGDVNQGILHTGDVAYVDEEGCIYLKGRLTRYVKVLDKRISLDDIENYLTNKIPGTEFACTEIDGQVSVFHTNPKAELDKEISAILDQNMKIPKKFVSCWYLEALPRNAAGKVKYAQLKR